MLRPIVVPLALLVSAVVQPYAGAAPGPCPMIVDARDDVEAPSGGTFDITSGDLSSTDRELVAVIGVAQLRLDEPTAVSGVAFRALMSIPGRRTGKVGIELMATHGVDGSRFDMWLSSSDYSAGPADAGTSSGMGQVDGEFNEDLSEVRIVVPLHMLAAHAQTTRGTPVRLAAVESRSGVVLSGESTPKWASASDRVDVGSGPAVHRLRTPGCNG